MATNGISSSKIGAEIAGGGNSAQLADQFNTRSTAFFNGSLKDQTPVNQKGQKIALAPAIAWYALNSWWVNPILGGIAVGVGAWAVNNIRKILMGEPQESLTANQAADFSKAVKPLITDRRFASAPASLRRGLEPQNMPRLNTHSGKPSTPKHNSHLKIQSHVLMIHQGGGENKNTSSSDKKTDEPDNEPPKNDKEEKIAALRKQEQTLEHEITELQKEDAKLKGDGPETELYKEELGNRHNTATQKLDSTRLRIMELENPELYQATLKARGLTKPLENNGIDARGAAELKKEMDKIRGNRPSRPFYELFYGK